MRKLRMNSRHGEVPSRFPDVESGITGLPSNADSTSPFGSHHLSSACTVGTANIRREAWSQLSWRDSAHSFTNAKPRDYFPSSIGKSFLGSTEIEAFELTRIVVDPSRAGSNTEASSSGRDTNTDTAIRGVRAGQLAAPRTAHSFSGHAQRATVAVSCASQGFLSRFGLSEQAPPSGPAPAPGPEAQDRCRAGPDFRSGWSYPADHLGLVLISRQIIGGLQQVALAMVAALDMAVKGELTQSTIASVIDQFDFMSLILEAHQEFVSRHILPALLEMHGSQSLPSNLDALYRMCFTLRNKAQAAVEKLTGKRRGVPTVLLTELQKAITSHLRVAQHAARMEMEEVTLFVRTAHMEDDWAEVQLAHYEAVVGEGNSSHQVIGLLFEGLTRGPWSTQAQNMGKKYPGWMSTMWALHSYRRTCSAPLSRLIHTNSQ